MKEHREETLSGMQRKYGEAGHKKISKRLRLEPDPWMSFQAENLL